MTGDQTYGIPRLGARVCLVLFLVALGVRVGATALVGFSTLRFGDGPAYIYAAKELIRTGQYPLATERFYFRAPGYPVFLAVATLGNPDRVPLAKIANSLLGAAAALVLAALSARIFRRRALAIATGGAAALHPGFVYLSTDVQSEPLFLLSLLCAGFLLLAASDRVSGNLAILAGVGAGLTALIRPSALVLLPLLAAPLFDRRYPLRARSHLAMSAVAGFLFALAPWTVRNALVFHELIPVNDAAGGSFYQGNSDFAVRFYRLKSSSEYRRWSRAMFTDLERQTADLERRGRSSPAERSRYFVQKAIEERRADLAGWARLFLLKSWDWLRPYPHPLFWSPRVIWATALVYVPLSILGALGLAWLPRPGVRLFLLVLLGVTMAVHVLLLVVWRYRIAFWDPILLLCGVFAGDKILERWKPRRV